MIDMVKINNSDAPKEVKEVYELLKKYKEDPDRKNWEEKVYKRCWEVAFGDSDKIWTEEEKAAMLKKKQIPVAINDCAKGIQGSGAVATANRPGINVKPIGSSDLYVAELIKRGFDYVWNQNRGQEVIFDVVKECKAGSVGVVDVKFDEAMGKWGKIVFESDNPLDYYFDKKSRKSDKSDSPLIKAHLITREYAKDNYDLTEEDLDFNPVSTEDSGKSDEGNKSDGYVDASKNKDKPKDTEEDPHVWEIEAWLIKTFKTFAVLAVNPVTGDLERIDFKTKEEAKEAAEALQEVGWQFTQKEYRIKKRIQRIIVGKKLISEEENPLGIDSDGDPVVSKILMGHDRSYTGFFVSPTYRAIEISRSRNKRRSQAIYTVSKNLEAPIMKPEGSKWETDEVHGDSLILPKDAAFQATRLLPGTTSAELIAMEQRDEQAINEEYDMNDVMKGKTPPGVEAYRAIASLQETGAMMSNPFIGVLEATIEKIAKVIYVMMFKYWPRQMWERLIDADEKTSWQPEKDKQIDKQTGEPIPPNPDDISMKWLKALDTVSPQDPEEKKNLDLENIDIRIVAGSTQPTNRMAKRMDAVDMVNAGIYPAEIALEVIDDPLKDKASAIIKSNREAQMQQEASKGVK